MNSGLGLVLIGLAGVLQSILVLNAQATLSITSIYVLTLIPLGVSLTLGGAEMMLAETIHRRFSIREKRPTRWKVSGRRGVRSLIGKLEVAAMVSFLLVFVFSFAAYFYVVGALAQTGVPYYARFVLAESVSMIVTCFAAIIIKRIV